MTTKAEYEAAYNLMYAKELREIRRTFLKFDLNPLNPFHRAICYWLILKKQDRIRN